MHEHDGFLIQGHAYLNITPMFQPEPAQTQMICECVCMCTDCTFASTPFTGIGVFREAQFATDCGDDDGDFTSFFSFIFRNRSSRGSLFLSSRFAESRKEIVSGGHERAVIQAMGATSTHMLTDLTCKSGLFQRGNSQQE